MKGLYNSYWNMAPQYRNSTDINERRCIEHQWVDIDCAAEERLLREADTSTTNEKGQTLLHLAVNIGSPQMIALSLNRGAVVSMQDQGGKTALHLAAKRGSQKT